MYIDEYVISGQQCIYIYIYNQHLSRGPDLSSRWLCMIIYLTCSKCPNPTQWHFSFFLFFFLFLRQLSSDAGKNPLTSISSTKQPASNPPFRHHTYIQVCSTHPMRQLPLQLRRPGHYTISQCDGTCPQPLCEPFFFLFYFFANGGISLLVSWQLSNMADEAPIGKFHSFLLFHKLNSSAHCGGIVFFPDALISG